MSEFTPARPFEASPEFIGLIDAMVESERVRRENAKTIRNAQKGIKANPKPIADPKRRVVRF